jgi:phenylpropionate dioxygenase-like ring-hydroxylating dioxygenase large terminal subunit
MKRTPGFDPASLRLPEIRTEVWEGWIYITLDPAAESLATRLRRLQPVVGPYDMAGYVPFVSQDHLWDTNWKLLTENFMEGYHLPVAHRQTVGAWFPAEETEFPAETDEAFTYQTFTKRQDARYGLAHPDNARLEGRWRFTSVMPTIFPTHMYVLAPDHLWYLSLRPKGTGQVHVRFGAALAPEVLRSLADPQAFIAETVAFFDKVNAEDRFVVEGIYAGSQAPLARPGRLSWLEREIHDFVAYLARRLAGGRGVAASERKLSAVS